MVIVCGAAIAMNRCLEFGGHEAPRRVVMSLDQKPPKLQIAGRIVRKMISLKAVRNSVVYVVLKAAWEGFGTVQMTDLEEGVMAFDFQNEKDRIRVLDMSPWVIHGHCLNLKPTIQNQCFMEVDFSQLSIWVQVHGLSPTMLNEANATSVAATIGKCTDMEQELEMQRRGYIRMKVEVEVAEPLKPGFWWSNERGQEKWADIRYERLSDFCYGCGILGHTAQNCNRDITTSDVNPKQPMYGPWTSCARQRKQATSHQIGGGNRPVLPKREPGKRTWRDMMRECGAAASDQACTATPKLEQPAHALPTDDLVSLVEDQAAMKAASEDLGGRLISTFPLSL